MSFASKLLFLCQSYVPTRPEAKELRDRVLDMVSEKGIPFHNHSPFDKNCNEGCGWYWAVQASSYDPRTRTYRNLKET